MAEPYLFEEAAAAESAVVVTFGDMSASVIMEGSGEATRAGSAAAAEGNATDGSGGGPGGGVLTLPAAAMKFADLTESGSESGDGEADTEPGTSTSANTRSSPPPNCAICLSRCKRKCFTDSCMHQFCFKCLSEWSKVKPECPLCKQPFKTIIHNVRTLDDYDRYPVQSSTPPVSDHSSLRFHVVNIRRPRYMPLLQNQGVMTNDLDGAEGGVVGADMEDAEEMRVNPSSLNRFMEVMNFYRHDQDGVVSSSSLSQLWRRYVYDRKLYALPVRDNITGQFREWSARFYRNNPAQMHRLMPWIHRDLVCLLRNVSQNVTAVMHLMHEILTMTNILGPLFRRRLAPFLGERTTHFIHELFNFARSPFDMIGYDRVVQYSARAAEEVEVDLLEMGSPESSNDSDVHLDLVNDTNGLGLPNASETDTSDYGTGNPHNRTAPARPSTSVIVTNPSATHSFSVTMASDGSELPGISIRRTTTSNVGSQTVAINLSMRRPAATPATNYNDEEVIEIDDGDAAANAEVAAITDGSSSRRHAGATLPVSAHIELNTSDGSGSSSSSDDDECVFVLERKPPHLRTPELVSLDSNSDSDVVFVDEQKAASASAAPDIDNMDSVNASEEAAAHAASELFLGPSTSSGVCSGSIGKDWRKVLEMTRRQDKLRSSARQKRSTRSQRNLSSLPPVSSSSSSDSPSSGSSSNFSSSTSDDDSGSNFEVPRRKKRKVSRQNMRKRSAKGKANKIPKKRIKRQLSSQLQEEAQDEEDGVINEQDKEQKENSSSSSISSSSDISDSSESSDSKDKKKNHTNSSSSDDDDDDSNENLQLSALRATLKAEAALEDRKPLKLELPLQYSQAVVENPEPETEEENTQPDLATLETSLPPKRRRTCSSSNLSNQSASLASNTTTTTTSSASGSALSPFKWQVNYPMMRDIASVVDAQDIANSLTQQASEPSLFNERCDGGVEDTIGFAGNPLTSNSTPLDDEAHMGIYSDAETSQQFPLDVTIDVVGEADADAEEAETDNDEEHEERENNEADDELALSLAF